MFVAMVIIPPGDPLRCQIGFQEECALLLRPPDSVFLDPVAQGVAGDA